MIKFFLTKMSIEVVLQDGQEEVLRDRLEMPLFFIVGGADDVYLSQLVGQPISSLVASKSVDPVPATPYVAYASRVLLPGPGFARTFPLSRLLEEKWPILQDVTRKENLDSERVPTNIEQTWIIRALRRMGQNQLANRLRKKMLRSLYPETLPIPRHLDLESLSRLYLDLSPRQRRYPLFLIVDDLPVQLPKSLGQALRQISLTQTLVIPGIEDHLVLEALQNAIALLGSS